MSSFRAKQIVKSQTTFSDEIKNTINFQLKPYPDRPEKSQRFEKWWTTCVSMYLAKDLDEVLAKVTPGALVVDDIDLTKISKPAKKTSRSEGLSSTSSLKRKGTQEVTKLESEETPKKKKRLQKLSEKKTPTEKVAAIAGRTRSSTKTSSPDQAESKETIHHAESTPTTEVKKRKTKTAPIKETQEEKETEKVEMEKSPSLVSSDSSPASLEATSEGPPVNPEHEASSQTPEKSRLSPFKPEPPTVQKAEIVEEEAEEDMEDFFKTAASLIQRGEPPSMAVVGDLDEFEAAVLDDGVDGGGAGVEAVHPSSISTAVGSRKASALFKTPYRINTGNDGDDGIVTDRHKRGGGDGQWST
ncbi:hypothetical protein RHGRI_031334 [Rhododendron griersonianum]|uniref:Uncharacterized protein n=1 Tax=Rhododendron griersonianum TaxID=479676 RepID=A0AAV6I7U2_9ERIC|nr:hypothetical protein RHGRI_031334 [Rhododendron griersonianum]